MLLKKKILIFTATYNEKDNIENLIRSINNNNLKVDQMSLHEQYQKELEMIHILH